MEYFNKSLSKAGEAFIKENEGGCKLIAYPDGKGINAGYSIGFGHYLTKDEIEKYTNSSGGITIDRKEAELLFQKDVLERVNALNKALAVNVSQPMFDALIDYGFSMSGDTLGKTELVKLINSGASIDAIKQHWLNSWIKYGTDLNFKPLVERRKKEWALASSKLNEILESAGLHYSTPLGVFITALLILGAFGLIIYYTLK